jgi:transcriptional regulator with XRE-family HTH domain
MEAKNRVETGGSPRGGLRFLPTPSRRPLLSNKEIGNRLRALRVKSGLTQTELANLVGSHQTALSQVEVGRRGVSLHQVLKLAQALNVRPDDIIGSVPHAQPARPRDRGQLRSGKILRRLEQIETLPDAKQRALLQMVDAFIEKHTPQHR